MGRSLTAVVDGGARKRPTVYMKYKNAYGWSCDKADIEESRFRVIALGNYRPVADLQHQVKRRGVFDVRGRAENGSLWTAKPQRSTRTVNCRHAGRRIPQIEAAAIVKAGT